MNEFLVWIKDSTAPVEVKAASVGRGYENCLAFYGTNGDLIAEFMIQHVVRWRKVIR